PRVSSWSDSTGPRPSPRRGWTWSRSERAPCRSGRALGRGGPNTAVRTLLDGNEPDRRLRAGRRRRLRMSFGLSEQGTFRDVVADHACLLIEALSGKQPRRDAHRAPSSCKSFI